MSLDKLSVMFDRRGQGVSKLVTNANVVDGMFTYLSNDLEARACLVNVTFSDITNFGRTETATVYDSSIEARYGFQVLDLALPGCVYEAQAIRKARWILYNNSYLTNQVSFSVKFYGMNFKLGDIIQVQDNLNQINAIGGRITSVNSYVDIDTLVSTFYLDRSITLSAGTYTFSYIANDGTFYSDIIVYSVTTNVTSVTFYGNSYPTPATQATFILTPKQNLYKVVKISRNEEETYTILANIHSETKYDYVEGTGIYSGNSIAVIDKIGDYANILAKALNPVTNITVSVRSITEANKIVNKLHVYWSDDSNPTKRVYYKLSYSKDYGTETVINNITTKDLFIDATVSGTYNIKVWVVDSAFNRQSTPTSFTYIYTVGATSASLLVPDSIYVSGTTGTVFKSNDLVLDITANPNSTAVKYQIDVCIPNNWTTTMKYVKKIMLEMLS